MAPLLRRLSRNKCWHWTRGFRTLPGPSSGTRHSKARKVDCCTSKSRCDACPASLAKPHTRQKNRPFFAWQAVSRVIDKHALHGSYVNIHTSVGTITLDGSILTFTDGMEGVFKNAGFAVVSRQRRLQGVFELIGLFNSVAAFEGWNATYDLPPKIPTTCQTRD